MVGGAANLTLAIYIANAKMRYLRVRAQYVKANCNIIRLKCSSRLPCPRSSSHIRLHCGDPLPIAVVTMHIV